MEGEVEAGHCRECADQCTYDHDSRESLGDQIRRGSGGDEHGHDQDDSSGLDAYDDDEGEEGEEHVLY